MTDEEQLRMVKQNLDRQKQRQRSYSSKSIWKLIRILTEQKYIALSGQLPDPDPKVK